MKSRCRALLALPFLSLLSLLSTACGGEKQPELQPPGRDTTAKTDALKAGSTVLQKNSPFEGMDVYVVGFHPTKDDPQHQMEAHHFCRQMNEDFAQYVLFDGDTRESPSRSRG